jgi:hypothetical protein
MQERRTKTIGMLMARKAMRSMSVVLLLSFMPPL